MDSRCGTPFEDSRGPSQALRSSPDVNNIQDSTWVQSIGMQPELASSMWINVSKNWLTCSYTNGGIGVLFKPPFLFIFWWQSQTFIEYSSFHDLWRETGLSCSHSHCPIFSGCGACFILFLQSCGRNYYFVLNWLHIYFRWFSLEFRISQA